jgi:hypothetical protein
MFDWFTVEASRNVLDFCYVACVAAILGKNEALSKCNGLLGQIMQRMCA